LGEGAYALAAGKMYDLIGVGFRQNSPGLWMEIDQTLVRDTRSKARVRDELLNLQKSLINILGIRFQEVSLEVQDLLNDKPSTKSS
jgi:hypothetical protein